MRILVKKSRPFPSEKNSLLHKSCLKNRYLRHLLKCILNNLLYIISNKFDNFKTD